MKLNLTSRRVSFISYLFVALFVLYGFFFYLSQQSLLKGITDTKLAGVQSYFEQKEKEEIDRLYGRADSIAGTIAKLSSTQLENSQIFNLQKEGIAATLEPFMDYAEIAAIEITDKESRAYASMWRIDGRNEFRTNYSLPPAFRERYKLLVSKLAIANGEKQGVVTLYIDDQSISKVTARIRNELRLSAEAEVMKLESHFHGTLFTQGIVLLFAIMFVLFFSRVIGRSYALIGKQREELEIFNSQLEERVAERTRQLEEQFSKVFALNKSMKMESLERKKAEEKYRAIFENATEGIFQTSASGHIISANQAMAHILGYDTPAELEETVSDLIAQLYADPAQHQAVLAAMEKEGTISEFEVPTRRKNGSLIWVSVTTRLVRNTAGEILFYEGTLRDVTQGKLAEAELKLAASVFHNTMDGVMIIDTTARIVSVNPAFTAITGYSAEEAVGQNSLLRFEHRGEDFHRELWDILQREGRWEGEIWNRRKNGEAFLEWLSIGAVTETDGNPVRYVGVFNDITELRRKDERIQHIAFHDSLTGLPNRALLLDRLEHGIAFALRANEPLGVMFIDLDRFKAVNDSLGHDIGDSLLQEVANRLRSCLRKSDTVARMGGDEFVVLLTRIQEPETYASLAQKIITSLSHPMILDAHAISVGASIGIACFPADGENAIELMKHADVAMYAAKAAGRGTYRFFQAAMTDKSIQRLEMEIALRNAASNDELELFYQPKISLSTHEVCGMEALVRWHHPTLGLMPPTDFIPMAEETGIISDLGDWVLEEACRQSYIWQMQGVGKIKIAVNISAKQLQRGDLVEHIVRLTRQHEISPSCLELELTESIIMANPEEVSKIFSQLRKIGVTIAVDDFGTGYSSLAYLRRLPIDTLKIDRSFVMNADRDDGDAQVVKIIIALGQALKLLVVAEGVETESQAEFLKKCGCSIAQGYLYSRPQPAAQIETWLQERTANILASAT